MPPSKWAPITGPAQPATRAKLTGPKRNQAEEATFRTRLRACLTAYRCGRSDDARKAIEQMLSYLDGIEGALTPTQQAVYAPVHSDPDGNPRRPAAALDAAANNVCLAVGAGDVAGARGYLGILQTLAGR